MADPMTAPTPTPTRYTGSGFTLTEMIISVALVLVLMLAITRIFSITSTTIGASQGFAAATRDARAAQAVFQHDLSSLAPDSPFIWIRQDLPTVAFRNAQDAAGDRDGNAATVDLDGDGTEGAAGVDGEQVGLFAVDTRSHRLDRFSFCARDRFFRQTGNSAQNTLIADLSSPEAWITYGHLTLPFPNGSFGLAGNAVPTNDLHDRIDGRTYPGLGTAQTNPLNYYASQWVLGRVAMVMVRPDAAGGTSASPSIVDASNTAQEFYGSQTTTKLTAMQPLSETTTATYPTTNPPQLLTARYDLVGANITDTSGSLTDYIGSNPATPWYVNMLNYRFQVNPFAIKPITAGSAAQQVPIFVPACSQFIVEFAGDFVAQNADGTLNENYDSATYGGLEPDGQVDFRFDPTTGARQIQWYGMPRSASGGLTASVANGDVVPLGAFVHYISGKLNTTPKVSPYTNSGSFTAANPDFDKFERYVKYAENTPYAPTATTVRFPTDDVYPTTLTRADPAYFDTYYAAFDPSTVNNPKQPRPKLFRITMTIDRPELGGRTAEGQAFEYVFSAP